MLTVYMLSAVATLALYMIAMQKGAIDTEKQPIGAMLFVALCPILNTVVVLLALFSMMSQ